MATLFSRILDGDVPSRRVFEDDRCVVVLAKSWVQPGHSLVIAREVHEDWLAAPTDLRNHLLDVAALIGRAQRIAWDPVRVGVSFTGLTFGHVHAHVVPLFTHADLDLAAITEPAPEQADDAQWRLRTALATIGVRPPVLTAR